MATFERFQDIDAWKKARELTREVYAASKVQPFSRDFALRNQIRKATISVMSNIAEGFERGGTREFIQFLSIAKASAGEVQSQLYIALDQGYLSEDACSRVMSPAEETGRIIGGLMKYLRQTSMKGQKRK